MSYVNSAALMDILEREDLSSLEKIPGVGKKTAGKMMLALKGKLKISETISIPRSSSSPYSDVIVSLSGMGYDKKLVEQKIAELVEELSKESAFNSKTQKEKEDLLFRRAIVSLA